jgi:hypothetical protein
MYEVTIRQSSHTYQDADMSDKMVVMMIKNKKK